MRIPDTIIQKTMNTNEMMENNTIEKAMPAGEGEIVMYQPDANTRLEVRLEDETVWLTQHQMAQLFDVKENTITYHIKEVYKNNELEQISTARKIRVVRQEGGRKINRWIVFYNLDMILSVGYRVNSIRGIMFRRWSSSVLKQHLLNGYTVNRQLVALQERTDERFCRIENRLENHQQQLDFFIRTSTPPAEMVFFNGEFFTARVAIENLIRTASDRVIIIDHYVDAKTFDMFDVRKPGVQGFIYTQGVGPGMIRLRDEHNRQPGVQSVEVLKWRVEPHDRFLIIDDRLYHCGHSLNATGSRLSAIMLMGTSPESVLAEMK